MSRYEIVLELKRIRHGMTPTALLQALGSPEGTEQLAQDLVSLEADRWIVVHRDSSGGQRMGGLTLPDGTSCTLVTFRTNP